MILFGNDNKIYETKLSETEPVCEYDYLTDEITFSEWTIFKTNEPKRQKIRDEIRAQLLPNINY